MSGDNKHKYRMEIQQMMFVSGEVNEPSVATTSLIEDIVRGQVVEILMRSTTTAHARGSKNIMPEDVIFLMRHDKAKVNRLRTYLSWKDLRKNAKDQDNNAALGGADAVDAADGGAGGSGGGAGAGGDAKDPKDPANMKLKKSTIKLPWELQFMFSEQPLQNNEDDEDDDEREAHLETMKRLKMADDRTKDMTREEYVHWSDCRQASFTFRKGKRFKDWSGITTLIDGKPHDDVIDILGFLTFEIVCAITETALKVKAKDERISKEKTDQSQNHDAQDEDSANSMIRKRKRRLFDGPENPVNPINTSNVQEAWRILQIRDHRHKALGNFKGQRARSRPMIL
ncbi:Transcription initiation protein spt3 [Hanseniaspora vineae]